MNKLLLLLGLTLVLSVQKDNHPTAIILFSNNLEIINGSVKQLIEIEELYSQNTHIVHRDTVNFDRKGNIIDTRTGNTGDKNYHIVYLYRYDTNGKPTEVFANSIGYGKMKYIYGNEDRITEKLSYDIKGDLHGKASYEYDIAGNVVKYEYYNVLGNYSYKLKYKYDRQYITEEAASGDHLDVFDQIYQYKSFDSKSNWTKLIKINKEPVSAGDPRLSDTITRKITYY